MQKRSLALQDFGPLNDAQIPKKSEAAEAEEHKSELMRLKAAHVAALEETKKAAYDAGFAKALEESEARCNEQLTQRLHEERERFIAAETLVTGLHESLERAVQNTRDRINEIVIDSLAEILRYFYLNEADAGKIAGMVEAILDEFDAAPEISVSLHPSQAEPVRALLTGVRIVEDEEIEPGDFKIDFADYLVEHILQEKIEVIKNEIKKEIEKSAEI